MNSPKEPHSGLFPPTAWSRIHAGRGEGSEEEVREALETICRRYWNPAFKFLCSLGCSVDDAQDITQQFFAHWATPEKLQNLAPERGRLRTYLKSALRRHFFNHWRAQQSSRRGSGIKPVNLDDVGEPPVEDLKAELAYDLAWADAVLDAVIGQLRNAYAGRGRGQVFEALVEGLPGGNGLKPYAEIAVLTGMKDPQIKIEMHRLRRRFADGLRREVEGTLTSQEDVDDELRHLLRVMAHSHGDPS